MTRNEVDRLRDLYLPGTRIILHKMEGEPRMYDGLEGSVTGVDDAGQIHMHWDNGSSLALSFEEDAFEITDSPQKLEVLLIEPGKYPRVVQIDDTLKAMQDLVGGYIEEYSPFEDDVSIVCNDEGKLHGLPLNRSVCNHDNGEIIDIIAGNFFIVGTPMDSDSFQPLSEELQRKYEKMFHYPERFTEQYGRISAEKYKPVSRDQER